jgi:hypothetical protein
VKTSNLALKCTRGYSERWGYYPGAEGLIYSRVGKRSRELGINKLRVQLITTVTPGSNHSNVLENLVQVAIGYTRGQICTYKQAIAAKIQTQTGTRSTAP